MSAHSETWLEARRRLRGYVRHGLYADLPLGEPRPTLSLPRLSPVRLEEADVYEARRGAGDPPVDDDGKVKTRSLVSGTTNDPTSAQAMGLRGWRIYAGRQLEHAESPDIVVEHATVLATVARLDAQHWRALHDLGHIARVRRVAALRSLSERAIKAQTASALDALLMRLYRACGEKIA